MTTPSSTTACPVHELHDPACGETELCPIEVQARVAGEIRLRIRDGQVVGLILDAFEGFAGYFGPPSEVIRDGQPDEDIAKAQKCLDDGFGFPSGWVFPEWCEWVV